MLGVIDGSATSPVFSLDCARQAELSLTQGLPDCCAEIPQSHPATCCRIVMDLAVELEIGHAFLIPTQRLSEVRQARRADPKGNAANDLRVRISLGTGRREWAGTLLAIPPAEAGPAAGRGSVPT
jgi:hypothetical protein